MKSDFSVRPGIARLGLALLGAITILPADSATEPDPHAAHRAQMAQQKDAAYQRSLASYQIPAITLTDMHGRKVSLDQELRRDTPVMLNFIFTTCGTICPVMTVTFARAQELLGAERDKVRMISISVDPEYDTPPRLREYAQRFKAGANWSFLTGSLAEVVAAQQAFKTYAGNKMNHAAATFLRARPDTPWVRLDGFASATDLVSEYHRLMTR
jgi:protein SCO1/2